MLVTRDCTAKSGTQKALLLQGRQCHSHGEASIQSVEAVFCRSPGGGGAEVPEDAIGKQANRQCPVQNSEKPASAVQPGVPLFYSGLWQQQLLRKYCKGHIVCRGGKSVKDMVSLSLQVMGRFRRLASLRPPLCTC